MKKVGLASDHAGFELKEFVKTWLTEKATHAKISVHTVQKAVTMQITPIRLHWL